jgi:hypothetical protein
LPGACGFSRPPAHSAAVGVLAVRAARGVRAAGVQSMRRTNVFDSGAGAGLVPDRDFRL